MVLGTGDRHRANLCTQSKQRRVSFPESIYYPLALRHQSRPLPIPTPIPPEGFVPSEELDAEYMTVDPEEDFEGWHGGQDSHSQWRKPGPKGFVGGSLVG
jgi:hypothetical protein